METNNALAVRTEMQKKLSEIDEKLKEVKAIESSTFKTNGEFRFNPQYVANNPIYIFKIRDLSLLLSILAYMIEKNEHYIKAANVLGLKSFPAFQWMGYTYEAWEHDIKLRVAVVTQHDRTEKLKAARAKLETFLTEEDRLAIVLKEISDL